MIKAIIFDLDGLLIDSQSLQYKAYNQAFSQYDAPLSLDDWQQWIHNGGSAQKWILKNNLSLEPEKVRTEKKKIYEQLIKTHLELKPGAQELIERLYGKFHLAIASSSRIESIEQSIKKFHLESRFEQLISDTKLARSKPHPDVFLKTAEAVNTKPEACIVIEDSLGGLQAAKAAKMKCIICPDSFSAMEISAFKDADKIVKSLHEITDEVIEKF